MHGETKLSPTTTVAAHAQSRPLNLFRPTDSSGFNPVKDSTTAASWSRL